MDPNETLRKMLDLSAEVLRGDDSEDNCIALAQAVEDMHTWIIKGGFLPDRWKTKETTK